MYGIIARADGMGRGRRVRFERESADYYRVELVTSRMWASRWPRREQAEAIARDLEELNQHVHLVARVVSA